MTVSTKTRISPRRPARPASLRQYLTFVLFLFVPVAAIGPNIGSYGLRTEHAFAFVAAIILLAVNGVPSRLPTVFWLVLLAWAVVFLTALISGLMPAGSMPLSTTRSVVDGLGRLAVPMLGLIIGAYAYTAAPPSVSGSRVRPMSVVQPVLTVLIVVACLNTAVAGASVIGGFPWLESLRPDGATATVSDAAAQGGRYGGMINQPFEAGLFYSIALLAIGCQWAMNVIGPVRFIGFASMVAIGGALSGSKVFLFGGLPATVVYLLLSGRPQAPRRLLVAGCAAVASAFAARSVLLQFNQLGLDRLEMSLKFWDSGDPTYTLFAGRLDADQRPIQALQFVLFDAGPFGFGASGGMTTAYDMGVIEFGAVAGWAGITAMILIAGGLLVAARTHRYERYWLALALLVVAANIGGPAFTANRNALVIWVLFGVMLCRRPSRTCRCHPAHVRAPVCQSSFDSGSDSAGEFCSGGEVEVEA